jgi:hypothetical protein
MSDLLCSWCGVNPSVLDGECLDCAALPGHLGVIEVMKYEHERENTQLRARAERAEAWLGKFLAIDESPTSIYFNENVAIAFIRLQIECQAALAQPDAADAGADAT